MRKPGHRVPVARMKMSDGVTHVLSGKPAEHMGVVGHVIIIVVVQEIEVANRRVNRQRGYRHDRAQRTSLCQRCDFEALMVGGGWSDEEELGFKIARSVNLSKCSGTNLSRPFHFVYRLERNLSTVEWRRWPVLPTDRLTLSDGSRRPTQRSSSWLCHSFSSSRITNGRRQDPPARRRRCLRRQDGVRGFNFPNHFVLHDRGIPLPFHQGVGIDVTRSRLPIGIKINLGSEPKTAIRLDGLECSRM